MYHALQSEYRQKAAPPKKAQKGLFSILIFFGVLILNKIGGVKRPAGLKAIVSPCLPIW